MNNLVYQDLFTIYNKRQTLVFYFKNSVNSFAQDISATNVSINLEWLSRHVGVTWKRIITWGIATTHTGFAQAVWTSCHSHLPFLNNWCFSSGTFEDHLGCVLDVLQPPAGTGSYRVYIRSHIHMRPHVHANMLSPEETGRVKWGGMWSYLLQPGSVTQVIKIVPQVSVGLQCWKEKPISIR